MEGLIENLYAQELHGEVLRVHGIKHESLFKIWGVHAKRRKREKIERLAFGGRNLIVGAFKTAQGMKVFVY